MPTFALLLGKNPVLSTAEALSYLRSRSIPCEPLAYRPSFLLFRADAAPHIEHLGGALKLLEVLAEKGPFRTAFAPLIDAFPHDKKHPIAVSGVGADAKAACNQLATELSAFLEERSIPFSLLLGAPVPHADLLAKRVLESSLELSLLSAGKPLPQPAAAGKQWLCRTISAHNPHEHRLRDTGRPRQRAIYSIPPRLAKTLVNLSGAAPNRTFLDPFCGVGAIVQEAALLGCKTHGTDRSRACIEDCRENMAWLAQRYRLAHPVSLRPAQAHQLPFPDNSIDCIATEGDMGPPLRHRPNPEVAKRIVKSLAALYTAFLCEALRVLRPGARLALVTPRFLGKKWDLGINVGGLAERFGGTLLDPLPPLIPHTLPLLDFTERHRTIREISVVEKTRGHVNIGRYRKPTSPGRR